VIKRLEGDAVGATRSQDGELDIDITKGGYRRSCQGDGKVVISLRASNVAMNRIDIESVLRVVAGGKPLRRRVDDGSYGRIGKPIFNLKPIFFKGVRSFLVG